MLSQNIDKICESIQADLCSLARHTTIRVDTATSARFEQYDPMISGGTDIR